MTVTSTVGLRGTETTQTTTQEITPEAPVTRLTGRRSSEASRPDPSTNLPRQLVGLQNVGTARNSRTLSVELGDTDRTGGTSLAASIRTAATREVTRVESVEHVDLTAIRTVMNGYYEHAREYLDGLGDERAPALAALNELIDSRARKLFAKGKTADDVKRVINKGDWADLLAKFVEGFFRSVPFGAMSAILDGAPGALGSAKTPAQQGAAAGGYFAAADHIGVNALMPVLDDPLWLAPAKEGMDPAMDAVRERTKPSTAWRAAQVATYVQTFTARNIFPKTLLLPFLPPEVAAIVLRGANSFGSALAGGGMKAWDQWRQRANHEVGPAVMFARSDWEEIFDGLERSNIAYSFGQRVYRAGAEVFNLNNMARAVKDTFLQPETLTMGGTLVAGFVFNSVLVAKASAYVQADPQLSDTQKMLIEQGVNLATMLPVYSAWAGAGALTKPLMDHVVKPAASSAFNGIRSGIQSMRRAAGSLATAAPRDLSNRLSWRAPADRSTGPSAFNLLEMYQLDVRRSTFNPVEWDATSPGPIEHAPTLEPAESAPVTPEDFLRR